MGGGEVESGRTGSSRVEGRGEQFDTQDRVWCASGKKRVKEGRVSCDARRWAMEQCTMPEQDVPSDTSRLGTLALGRIRHRQRVLD